MNVQYEIRLLHRHVARKPATGSRVAQEGVGARQGKSKNRIDFGGRRLRPLQTEWDEIRNFCEFGIVRRICIVHESTIHYP